MANDCLCAEGLRIENSDTIIDEVGRRVRIAQPFHRIISLYGAHTENLLFLGLDEQIVGVESGADHPNKPSEKTEFSYHDDPEKFLAFHPDLVLIRPMIDRGYPQLVQRLSDHGITVVSLQPGTVEEMYTYWQILGMLAGREKAALQMTADFKAAVADFRSLTKDMASKKRVYFEAIHDKMKTFTPDSMAVFALQTAGGINIAADADAVRGTNIAYYGKERILARGPQIDVYLAQAGPMNQPTIVMIETEPGYEIIEAVRRKEIYIIEEQIVSRPTPRLLIGIETIGKALYPVVFTAEKTAKITNAISGLGGRH
ncbi:MAG: ABC transporter substrate-binding protein [Deltaproteobacteria bacterium]|nr:ABC transporter substrate-binding protein [Deltaproteobacteria bacterium]